MNVASILEQKGRSVVTKHPDTLLIDIAKTLSARKIGAIVITGVDDQVAGIISERDVVRALSEDGEAALSARVGAYMTRRVVTCSLDDNVSELMSSMTQGRFRHLPVMGDGKLVGIISIGDVVKERIAEALSEAEAMRDYIAAG